MSSRSLAVSGYLTAPASRPRNGGNGPAQVNALKCPELLLRGVELQRKAPLEQLEKKGKRFESPWNQYHVALFAGVFFYYDDLADLPRGLVPLAGAAVKPVDRIFKNSDQTGDTEAEECGPCFKVTSCANRVLLFRCESEASRALWIHQIQAIAHPNSVFGSARSSISSDGSTTIEAAVRSSPMPSNRFSLDETQMRRAGQSQRRALAASAIGATEKRVANDPEISQMLREAMAMVKKQNIEILELRKALEEARTTTGEPTVAEEAPQPIPAEETVANVVTNDADVDVDDVDVDDVTRMSMLDDDLLVVAPPPPPPPTVPPFIELPVSSTSPPGSLGAPLAVDANTTDYLQKQAMELAEIARYLQLTFHNDIVASTKQTNSGSSTSPTEMMDHMSSTSSNYSDQPSEADEESDSERLSEFVESDAKFLESSGMLDSIHKVMRDFMSPTNAPRSISEQYIINDDVIAEIRQGTTEKKRDAFKLMDPSALRSLRSQSECDEVSDYKLTLSPRSIARTQSAREFSIDDFNSPAPSARHRKRVPKELSILVVEDNMAVVSSILQTASREQKTALLLPLVRVFNRHDRLSRLIQWAIESEVASVMNVATLFRSDDYASRLVSTYSKLVGSNFIKVALTDPIREIYKLKLVDVDLTPAKHDEAPDSEAIHRNAENLMSACQIVLDSILANKQNIPSSYFHICSHLNARVINRFDGSMEGLAVEDPASLTRAVIGGFIFLRFVCPAITTPHLHDLVDKEPVPETRKILVLVTKLLFKTATSVLFNEKEAHLKVLNPFIEKNSPAIQELFFDLAIAPSESIDECFASDSQNMFSDLSPDQPEVDITVIRTIAEKNLGEIEKKLSVSGYSPATAENLRASIQASKTEADARTQKTQRPKKLNMKFLSSFSKIVRKQPDV